jgi:DNA adenine methylase
VTEAPAQAPPRSDPNKYQLMPAYTAEQFAELKEDIRQHGVLQPIEFDTDGNLLDGHHRFRAFSELIAEGCDLPMFDRVTRQFDNEEDKIAHVLSLNVRRRHLTPPQISELCGKLRMPPFNYTLAKIGQVVGMSAVGVWSAIARLDQATRDQIDQEARIVGKDGSVQLAFKVAPRVFQTGQASLQAMQRDAVAAIGAELLAAAEVAAQNGDNGGSVDLDPSVQFVVGSGKNEGTVQITDDQLILPSKPLVIEATEAITVGEAQRRTSAFAWYGGKFSQLDWLLPLLPPCRHFVDVFGGSGAVVMNRPPSPLETYNDLDKDVVHFFRVIRDPTKLQELLRQLELTPYSREERTMAHLSLHRPESEEIDEIERARLFFVLARQSTRGQVQFQGSPLGIWKFTRDVLSRGMAGTVSSWQYGIDGLAAVAARFRTIQVENYPAIRIIELYDTPDTLFYCDPPYVQDTRETSHRRRDYTNEMSDNDHRALAAVLHKIKGRAAISGFPSQLYDELYGDWNKIMMPRISGASAAYRQDGNKEASDRIEVLWTNYPLGKVKEQEVQE